MLVSVTPPYHCPTCERPSVNPRNLAVFIDGTSNKPGDKDTNVMKLHDHVEERSEPEQHRLYLEGIGAYEGANLPLFNRVSKAIYSSFEVALAWNVEKNVKEAYGWLVEKYRDGDRIYLFGFSRGAYQVRALASMIHEVGLVKGKDKIDSAYNRYLSIDPYNTETRDKAITFKRKFCWHGVRIHFIGVWDTVSSLGLIKTDVHVTSSVTVTNACHFRHALALDERRVKFMPEYFAEVNARPYFAEVNARLSTKQSSRPADSDVKEVWFAGCHSDIGGITREQKQLVPYSAQDDDFKLYPVHAGNVPLLWMRREAAAYGLVFSQEEFAWDSEDVDHGRTDTMKFPWNVIEIFPIRHQVSFSGTGEHKWRWHLSRPRSVIPDQQIHSSVLSGDVYTPRATLRDGVDIPTVLQTTPDGLWTTEIKDEKATTCLFTSLLSDQRKTLRFLEMVLFLLNSRLDSGQTIPRPQFDIEAAIRSQVGFNKLALTVIYSNFSVPDGLISDAREALRIMLSTSKEEYPPEAFYVLRFLTRHEKLRNLFIARDMIGSFMSAVKWTAESPSENLFPLVMDSLRYLIKDDGLLRDTVMDQLSARPRGAETTLSVTLEVEAPCQLTASLKMIAAFAQYKPDLCKELKPRIFELAETERDTVGSAAVEALVALKVSVTSNIHFRNILGYLRNILPPLDVEVGTTSSAGNTGALPAMFQVDGSVQLKEEMMQKLVLTIESRNVHDRTAATLTLFKLCRNSTIREKCPREKVVQIFMKQLEREDTSLLAAYALKTYLETSETSDKPFDFPRAAQLIVAMLDKGWFDDAVGRVEGSEIFRDFMKFGELRKQVLDLHIVTALLKKLEGGERHAVRMSLICLDILEKDNPVELTSIVERSIENLRAKDIKTQKKAVKILSALAQTTAGEQAIKPYLTRIVQMLLPPSQSRSQLYGPASAVYALCKNETLREQIKGTNEFNTLARQRRAGTTLPSRLGNRYFPIWQ